MASASNTNSISNAERRWVVIGVCLTKVLTPALRNVLATEIPKWHQVLCQPPTEVNKQVFGRHQKSLHPSTLDLNYKNINNNHTLRSPHVFDYTVKDPLSLAKLFVKPFMCKFTGFDKTMDTSAVLSVISEAAPFALAAAHAKAVRSDVRNEWGHCKFAEWTEAKFFAAFQNMETLLKNINFSPDDEQNLCDELNSWKVKGFQLCFGQPVDIEILTLLRGKVDELFEDVQTWSLEKEQILSNISGIQANLKRAIDDLRARIEKAEMQGTINSRGIKRSADQIADNSKKIKLLDERTTEMSGYYIKEEEKIPYAFTAPPRNLYFAGRTEQIQELKGILKVEETLNVKKVRVAAVCGLGGIGKTSLVSEYAHQMKDFYKGGVYWFCAEDDTHLSKTVNAVAVKIGALLGSFDLTLPSILKKISKTYDPCLIVLDCLDQLDLSSNVMEFLSFPSQENICGHFIVLTRRNPKRLVNEVSVFEEDSCLVLKCLQPEEAKNFLFSRTKVTRDENVEIVAECLCEELGRLPLALEQAGAYIQMRRCSFSMYLEQYKAERLRLLSRQRARAAGNDSSERLAVHTTWLMNIEHMKKSTDGQAAVRFMNACSFFDGNEIEEELINIGTPKVEDVAYRECVSSPLGPGEVLKLLTDFSLFTYVEAHSVSTHRLVQELVWESLTPELKAESFIDAVRMLSFAFSKRPSPSNHVSLDERSGEEPDISFSDPPNSPSHFYMWSKFCIHGHRLCRNMEDLLISIDSICLDSVWFPETAKILYECAVHLSADHKQEEAKRTLNFAYRIVDWLPLEGYDMVEKNVANNFLFPLPIPIPQLFQTIIQQYCIRPFISRESLNEKPATEASDLAPEVSDLASEASDLAPKAVFASEASSLCHRASDLVIEASNLDLEKKFDKSEMVGYNSWKGYALKALALDSLNREVNADLYGTASAEIAAALAFYHNRDIFSDFPPFVESFVDLQKRIFICDSVDELLNAIFSQEEETRVLKILVLGSEEYILNSDTVDKPWDNCILVGTRTNCSVSLRSNHDISLLKCMLTNLSFSFYNQSHLFCLPDSFVKFLKCNFTSCDDDGVGNGDDDSDEMACIHSEGEFNAEQCNFTRCPLKCSEQSRSFVSDCSFRNSALLGLLVVGGATLEIEKSRIYNNCDSGLFIRSSECVVVNCDIHDNGHYGIRGMCSSNVTLKRNNVFNNYESGIRMENCEVNIEENNISDNDLRGISTAGCISCNISMNKVIHNKTGGVYIDLDRERFSPACVVKLNKICHNGGPGLKVFVDNIKGVKSGFLNPPDAFPSFVKFQNNEMHHNKENVNDSKLNLSVPYCSYCRVKCKPTMCEKCFTAAYCSESCQNNHYSKHKEICNVLREKSSYLVTSTKEVDLEEITDVDFPVDAVPKLSFPPRGDMRFVVKVHTSNRCSDPRSHNVVLYDRNLGFRVKFDSKVFDQLLKEFGVHCDDVPNVKKLFFHCLLEDNGQLRLFTNDFAEFETHW